MANTHGASQSPTVQAKSRAGSTAGAGAAMNENVLEQKAALRRRVRNELKRLSPSDRLAASTQACSRLQQERIWREAQIVLLAAFLVLFAASIRMTRAADASAPVAKSGNPRVVALNGADTAEAELRLGASWARIARYPARCRSPGQASPRTVPLVARPGAWDRDPESIHRPRPPAAHGAAPVGGRRLFFATAPPKLPMTIAREGSSFARGGIRRSWP